MVDTTSAPLVIERIFDASVPALWHAWTDPAAMKNWWGPKNFTAPVIQIDLKVGGKYLWCMRGKLSPAATETNSWTTGTYKEIIPLKKLVYTDSFSDKDGRIVSSETYGMKGFPMELEVTVEFEELPNSQTKMTLTHVGLPAGQLHELTRQGWQESFDKLVDSVQA